MRLSCCAGARQGTHLHVQEEAEQPCCGLCDLEDCHSFLVALLLASLLG